MVSMMKDTGLHLSAIASYLRMLRRAWTDGDPDHAGHLMVKPCGDQHGGLRRSDPSRALEVLPSLQSMRVEPGLASTFTILVDLADLAKQAEQRIAAATAVHAA
jgi:hypothetical protein